MLDFGVTWGGLCYIFMSNNKRTWHELAQDHSKYAGRYSTLHSQSREATVGVTKWKLQEQSWSHIIDTLSKMGIISRITINGIRRYKTTTTSLPREHDPLPRDLFPEQIYGPVLICIMDFCVNCPFKVTFPTPVKCNTQHTCLPAPLHSNVT